MAERPKYLELLNKQMTDAAMPPFARRMTADNFESLAAQERDDAPEPEPTGDSE